KFDRLAGPAPDPPGAGNNRSNLPMPVRRSTPSRSMLGLVAATLVLGLGGIEPLAAQTPTGGSAATTPAESGEIQRLIREGQHAQALKLIDEALAKSPK